MKVVHFTNNDFDGAGRAVLRLNRGLREKGVDSVMVVLYKHTLEPNIDTVGAGKSIRHRTKQIINELKKFSLNVREIIILIIQLWHRLLGLTRRWYWKPRSLFSFNESQISFDVLKPHIKDANAICFHGVQEFITSNYIHKMYKYTEATIILHPRDMELLTGGCHFNFGCDRYTKLCGDCPQLGRTKQEDITRLILKSKSHDYKNVPLYLVASNSFVKERIKKSLLFRDRPVSVIYMGIEPKRYSEIDRYQARHDKQLPTDEKIILFGCFNTNDKRKGAHLLKKTLQDYFLPLYNTSQQITPVRLVTFGSLQNFTFDDLPLSWSHLGYIESSKEMNLLYRAADVLVSPSMDDLGPTIVQEAFMNNLPIVSFELGLAVDLVINGVNGYRVPCFDLKKFGKAIYSILTDKMVNSDYVNKKIVDLKNKCTLQYEANAYMNLISGLSYSNS